MDADNIELIGRMVEFALERGYHVILEGILRFSRRGGLLGRRRHHPGAAQGQPIRFGEKEMSEWRAPNDMTGFPGERIIPSTSS